MRWDWRTMPRVLRMGRNRLKTDPSVLAEDVLILVPDDLELTALERELLDSLPREKVLRGWRRSANDHAR